jgi:5-hydroxyisourate hydrolase-like protein (transthyretin family)
MLAYLRNSKGGTTPSEISGEAVVEFSGYPWKRVPLPKTKIHLNAQTQTLEFVSDEDGRFRAALSPGKYTVTAEFPTGYKTSAYSSHPPIIVVEHRCTRLTIGADPTASITAHIVDVEGGQLGPMSNVQLTLETAKDQQFVVSVWPDEKSDLKAENLLPGDYILGLNTSLPVNRGSAPYPPTYYPGVAARSEAQVIMLRPGEQKVLSEMRIKKGQECEIPIVVTDSSGKPSPSSVVGLAYRDYPHFYIEPRQETDNNGRVTVYAVFPGPVFLRAEKRREDGSSLESESLELSACPSQTVSLKLSHTVAEHSNASQK